MTFIDTQRQSGRGLIELMISLVIGSIVMAAVLFVAVGTTSAGRRTDAMGQLTESGQVALQVISQDMRLAGYSFPLSIYKDGSITRNYSEAGLRGCGGTFSNLGGSGAATNLNSLTCPTGSDSAGSASFTVVYESDEYTSIPVASNDVGVGVAPTDCRGFGLRITPGASIGVGNTMSQADANTGIWLIENRYFLETDNDTGSMSLKCTGNGGTSTSRFSSSVTLVRGIERMEITYGVANGAVSPDGNSTQVIVSPGIATFMTAAQIDAAWPTETPSTRWQRVVSAHVCLVLLGPKGSADILSNGTNSSYVNCSGQVTAITDGQQRRAVSMTVNLRNRTTLPNKGIIGHGGV